MKSYLYRGCFSAVLRAIGVSLVAVCLACAAVAAPVHAGVRVSAWYWLNSAPKSQWAADFANMKALGLTDVVLVWGLDGAAFATRTADSHEAIESAQKAGLGSYLFVWHARYSSLPHDAKFAQVDAAGQRLFAFDAFDPAWRATQWKTYLQTLAREYGREPGMAGYVFDNSFAIGYVGAVDGAAPAAQQKYLSYGEAERKLFGKPLPASPGDPLWAAWTSARQQWWADWAKETRDDLRAVDRNPEHAIVLEDGQNTIDPDTEVRAGLRLDRVTPYFDRMAAYWAPHWSDANASSTLARDLQAYLGQMRAAVGPEKELALSLRLSDDASEKAAGHAEKPTLAQIRLAIDTALAMGIRRIDLYGYRMGVYHLDQPGWNEYLPGTKATYPLTGQMEGKFLADRQELWPGLRTYLEQVKAGQAH